MSLFNKTKEFFNSINKEDIEASKRIRNIEVFYSCFLVFFFFIFGSGTFYFLSNNQFIALCMFFFGISISSIILYKLLTNTTAKIQKICTKMFEDVGENKLYEMIYELEQLTPKINDHNNRTCLSRLIENIKESYNHNKYGDMFYYIFSLENNFLNKEKNPTLNFEKLGYEQFKKNLESNKQNNQHNKEMNYSFKDYK